MDDQEIYTFRNNSIICSNDQVNKEQPLKNIPEVEEDFKVLIPILIIAFIVIVAIVISIGFK